jgi:hypothetical protein
MSEDARTTPALSIGAADRQEAARQSTMKSARAAREGAEAAGAAANAAAANAGKPGAKSSEFKATLIAFALSAGFGALEALSHIPGPWQITAAVIVAAAIASGAYSASRGKVKAAALANLAPTVEAQSGAVFLERP